MMDNLKFDPKDLLFGVLFVGFAIIFAIYSYATLPIGTPARMGPGFFPLVLAAILAIFGLIVGIRAFGRSATPLTLVTPRAFVLVILAPIVFGLTVRTLGFAIGIALITGMSAFASRHMTVSLSIKIAIGFSVFCVLVFHYALNMPIPVLGSMFKSLNIHF